MKFLRERFFLAISCYLLSIGLSGCASVKEACRGVAGISTKVLEDGRKDALKKSFAVDSRDCYSRAKLALKAKGAYIYTEDTRKQLIALYISEQDTTPIGVFFSSQPSGETLVEVSSPSTYARETIAGIVFAALDNPVAAKKEGENAKEKTSHKRLD